MLKRLLIAIVLLVILVPSIIIGVLLANQDEIVQRSIASANNSFAGELVVGESHIAPFVNFPNVSVDLQEVKFYENKQRNTLPLYEAEDIYLGFDLWDLIRGIYHIEKILVSNGHLDVIRYPDGNVNVLLAKGINEDPTDTASAKFYFDLQNLVVENFEFIYEDQQTGRDILAHIDRVKAALRVAEDHTFAQVDTRLVLDIDENKEHTFFNNKHLELDLRLDLDQKTQILEISPSTLELEKARFDLQGICDLDDNFNLNITLNGQKPDFGIFAAFAPIEVAEALANYQNEGDIFFQGTIKGKTGNGYTPAVRVDFGCKNAWFLNKGNQKRVDELTFTGYYTNGEERTMASSEIMLQQFHARPEEGEFDATLLIQNFTDPYINVDLHADLDLGFLSEFFQIEIIRGLSGQVLVDMNFREMINTQIPAENLARLKEGIDSELRIKNLNFKIPGHPHPIKNANCHAVMKQGRITLDTLHVNMGLSDIQLRGTLSDFPALFHGFDKPVEATLSAKSNTINLKEILAFNDSLAAGTNEEISQFNLDLKFSSTGKELTNFTHLPKGEFYIENFYAKLKNYAHTFHDFHADVIIDDRNFKLVDFTGEIDETDFHFSGKIENYPKWFLPVKQGDSNFDFDLVCNELHPSDLLAYNGQSYLPADYANEEIRNLKLHGRLDLHYDSLFQSADFYLDRLDAALSVHPLSLHDFAGNIHYENERISINNLRGYLGESDFVLSMIYDTDEERRKTQKDNKLVLESRRLNLDELMNYELSGTESKSEHSEAFNVFDIPFSHLDFSCKIDELNYHTYWLQKFEMAGRATPEHYLYLDTLSMRLAEGTLGMKGYFNGSDPENIYFSSTMLANKLDIDKLMIKFENFGQDYFINENIHGKISGTVTSKFWVYPDFTPILEKSESTMDLTIYDGRIDNFAPLQAMAGYFKDKNLNKVRFDTLQNVFTLRNSQLEIPAMTINSSLGFIELSGKQGLDLTMDYFVRVPLSLVTQAGFTGLFGRKREEIDPEQEDAIVYRDSDKRVRFVNINITGTPDTYKIALRRDKTASK